VFPPPQIELCGGYCKAQAARLSLRKWWTSALRLSASRETVSAGNLTSATARLSLARPWLRRPRGPWHRRRFVCLARGALHPLGDLRHARGDPTAAQPTQMMNCRVRACADASAADAAAAHCLARTMILSASGDSCWLPSAISFSRLAVFSARLFHCARLAAQVFSRVSSCVLRAVNGSPAVAPGPGPYRPVGNIELVNEPRMYPRRHGICLVPARHLLCDRGLVTR